MSQEYVKERLMMFLSYSETNCKARQRGDEDTNIETGTYRDRHKCPLVVCDIGTETSTNAL